MPDSGRRTRLQAAHALGALSAVGISFVLAVVIGFFAGHLLDRWLGLAPLFTIICFFIGVAAGVVNVVRAASGYGRGAPPPDGSGDGRA